jgi:hypothetical protein
MLIPPEPAAAPESSASTAIAAAAAKIDEGADEAHGHIL